MENAKMGMHENNLDPTEGADSKVSGYLLKVQVVPEIPVLPEWPGKLVSG